MLFRSLGKFSELHQCAAHFETKEHKFGPAELSSNALPRLADELVMMAMDKSVKPYSRIAAISEAFKIVNTNVLEAEQRKQLQAIRAHLDRLEDGGSQVIDV